jgi:hypothetical protein
VNLYGATEVKDEVRMIDNIKKMGNILKSTVNIVAGA